MNPKMEALVEERRGLAIEVGRLQAKRSVGEKGRFFRVMALTYGCGGSAEFQAECEQRAVEMELRQRLARIKEVTAILNS